MCAKAWRACHKRTKPSHINMHKKSRKSSVKGREGKTPGSSNFMDIHFRKLSLFDDSKLKQKRIHETKI